VKKFKIDDYKESRRTYDKEIYTVDGKSTKCHDDALYIEPL
jgi:exoribonuclease R